PSAASWSTRATSTPASPPCTRSRTGPPRWAWTRSWAAATSTCRRRWRASAGPRRRWPSCATACGSPARSACWTRRTGCGAIWPSPCTPWDEAAEAAGNALRVERGARPRAGALMRLAHLALDRGNLTEASRHLSAARASLGTHDPMPQYALPLTCVALGIAAGEGRLPDARAELLEALDAGFPAGTQRYGWPLLVAAAGAEADALGAPATDSGRPAVLDRLRAAAKTLATGAP